MAARPLALLTLSLALVGCAHSPGGRWNAKAHERCAGTVCYRVGELPAAWQVAHEEGGAVGFLDDRTGALIASNATCRDDAEAVPLASLTDHLLLGYTERRVRRAELVSIAHRDALHTVVDAKLDGVPLVLDLYVMKRNGCIFDLSFASPPSSYPEALPAFERFVAGFADERHRSGEGT